MSGNFRLSDGFGRPIKRRSPGEPLRTLREMAEMIGVPYGVMQKRMAMKVADPPAPFSRTRSKWNSSVWYRPSEVRAWWVRVMEVEKCAA